MPSAQYITNQHDCILPGPLIFDNQIYLNTHHLHSFCGMRLCFDRHILLVVEVKHFHSWWTCLYHLLLITEGFAKSRSLLWDIHCHPPGIVTSAGGVKIIKNFSHFNNATNGMMMVQSIIPPMHIYLCSCYCSDVLLPWQPYCSTGWYICDDEVVTMTAHIDYWLITFPSSLIWSTNESTSLPFPHELHACSMSTGLPVTIVTYNWLTYWLYDGLEGSCDTYYGSHRNWTRPQLSLQQIQLCHVWLLWSFLACASSRALAFASVAALFLDSIQCW